MAKTVEEVQVQERAVDVEVEISAIARRESFRRDPRLRTQLLSSSQRIAGSIAEGMAQATDRAVVPFFYRARAATRETLAQLVAAATRRHVSTTERARIGARLEDLARMLTTLIARLESR